MNREQLASLLWDPAPEELARASLRQSLKEIREALGTNADIALHASRFVVGLGTEAVESDVGEFRDLLSGNGHQIDSALAAAALWKGELFGANLPNAPVFEAWVQVERSNLRSKITKVLTDQLELMIAANDFSDARIAEELVRIERSHELAHQYLMRFHASRGDQAAALRQYSLMDRILAEELDSEPSKESNDLLVAIKRGDISAQQNTLAPERVMPTRQPHQGPPKITIRPPLTRFTDASKDYLGEGFAFQAKVCLSRFRCWIVIPWPSKGFDSEAAVDYTAVGAAIDADFVVDSVLDWRGDRGKLFVSLMDCRDGSQVWSNIYSIAENELQEMGSTVAGAVAANLASQVNYISLLRFARNVPGSPAAYDMWLKGHQLSRLWNAEADETAEALFHKAIELDPGLACAYASLASILNTRSMVRPGYRGREEDCAKAFKFAQQAIALDPFDSRCHISMAWSWLIARSPERSHSHFKLAVELNPHDSETLIAAAMGMAFMGRTEDAQRWSTLALNLNPVHPEYFLGYLAGIQFLGGQYNEAIETVEKCPDVFADLTAWEAASLAKLGKREEAVKAYRKFCALTAPRWEGGSLLAEDDLERWLFDVMPIEWPQGRREFEAGIRLARGFSAELPAAPVTGTAA